VGVVSAEREAGAQQVPGDVLAPVGAVDGGVVAEGLGDPVGIEGLAVDHPPARALVGGDVQVHVGEADDVALVIGPPEGPAGRAHVRLRELTAASDANRDEQGGLPMSGGEDEVAGAPGGERAPLSQRPQGERTAGGLGDAPVSGRARRLGSPDHAAGPEGDQPAVTVHGQVAPQAGGLPEECGGGAPGRLVSPVGLAARADVPTHRDRPQREAGIGQMQRLGRSLRGGPSRARGQHQRRKSRTESQTSGHPPAHQAPEPIDR
jgi:hypothetical protein